MNKIIIVKKLIVQSFNILFLNFKTKKYYLSFLCSNFINSATQELRKWVSNNINAKWLLEEGHCRWGVLAAGKNIGTWIYFSEKCANFEELLNGNDSRGKK